ncbi:MAG: Glutathione hydrolase-like YwrD proenzyme [Acidimicrobiaceae bacterium]|nr:Glutathione hydrolase-like YwrD proenzyme [Acidimicrobiaceae bacterium]
MTTAPWGSQLREAETAMVASIDSLATRAGVDVMAAGGNAVDAAIATNAVLSVTAQHMCGLGGDLFALVHTGSGPPACLNASGRAGSGADLDGLLADGLTSMPHRGDIRSVPVPGCVDGWWALHQRFGSMPLPDLMARAIDLAEHGFAASPLLAGSAQAVQGIPGGGDFAGLTAATDVVTRPGVASVLRAFCSGGRDGVYKGRFGDELLAVGGGEYSAADLDSPSATWVDPLGADVWGHRVWTVPPNSQGYLSLAAARIAEGLDLPPEDDPLRVHLLVESARQAGFDRPDVLHENADGRHLIADDRLAPRREAIRPDRVAALGDSWHEGDTMYMCAVDERGMAVSLIQSNADGFGSHLTLPGLGVFLHNRGIGFSTDPDHPGRYGPGRRPPHTLAPALVTHPDGRLRAVLGTMGADAQPQVVLQMLVRLLVDGADPGHVVGGGRWVLSGGSGFGTWDNVGSVEVVVEEHAPPDWAPGLADRGHRVRVGEANFGHAHCIEVVDGGLRGAADPRSVVGEAAGI